MRFAHVISIGHDCASEEALHRYVRQVPNSPFDRAGTPDLRGVFELILSKFDPFIEDAFEDADDIERMWRHIQPTRVGRYGVHFRHKDFSRLSPANERCENVASLARGCIRMVNALSSDDPVLLLRNSKAAKWTEEFWLIDEYASKIREAYRNGRIEILQVCVSRPDFLLGDWFNGPAWRRVMREQGLI